MRLISGKAYMAAIASITVALGASVLVVPATQASGPYAVVATVPVGSDPWGIALSPDGTQAYVANYSSATLSIINTAAFTTSTVGVGRGPAYLALTPDGTTAYLPSNSDDSVAIVNLTTQTLTGALTGVSSPWAVAINGDDSLFVFDYSGANSPVRRFNLQTGLVDDSVTTSSYAWSATISQDGARLYAPMSAASKLAVLRTSDMTVTSELATPGQPRYAVLSPDQSSVYVTSNVTAGAPLVLRVNTQTLTVDDSWVIGPNSYRGFGIATSPDGAKIYVALESPSAQPGNLVVVDSATGQVDDSIAVGVNPFGVAVSPTGDRIYVTNNLGNSVSVISTPTPAPTPPAPVVPPVAADRPRDAAAEPGDRSATVSWTGPTSSGSYPVSHYMATSSPGGRTCVVAAPALSCEVGDLINGTAYTFTVKALTGAGWSPASEPSNVVVPRADAGPSIVITGARDGRVVTVSGTSTGLGMGGTLRPWIRSGGQTSYSEGTATILVSMYGTFEWSRRTGKRVSVYVETPDGSVRSNAVTIAAR